MSLGHHCFMTSAKICHKFCHEILVFGVVELPIFMSIDLEDSIIEHWDAMMAICSEAKQFDVMFISKLIKVMFSFQNFTNLKGNLVRHNQTHDQQRSNE